MLQLRRLRHLHPDGPLTQSDLARRSGLTRKQVEHYETLATVPRAYRALIALADTLGVTVDELFSVHVRHRDRSRP